MKFALPKYINYIFGFVVFISLLLGFTSFVLFILCIYSILLFFSRLTPPVFQEDLAYKDGIFFSPINGDVVSIEGNKIVVVIPWWRSFGIYLPMKSEIKNVIYHLGHYHFRYFNLSKSSFNLDSTQYAKVSFMSSFGEFAIDFIKCPLGLIPYFQVMPGDRGKALVMVGHFVLGGTVIINLPPDYKVKIKPRVKLSAGETILASRY